MRGFAAFVAFWPIFLPAYGAEPSQAAPLAYSLEFDCEGWEGMVLLNGVPVQPLQSGWGGSVELAPLLLTDGPNRVEVEVTTAALIQLFDGPESDPQGTNTELDDQRRLKIRFLARPCNREDEEYETLAEIDVKAVPATRKAQVAREFAAHVPMRWSWLDAEPIGELRPEDRADILRLVRKEAAVSAKGDLRAWLELMELGLRDLAMYFGESRDFRAEMTAQKTRLFSQPVAEVRIADEKDIIMQPCGRLLWVGASNHWTMRMEQEDGPIDYDDVLMLCAFTNESDYAGFRVDAMYFCKLRGAWRRVH